MTSLWGIDSLLAFLRSTTHQIEKPISFPCHTMAAIKKYCLEEDPQRYENESTVNTTPAKQDQSSKAAILTPSLPASLLRMFFFSTKGFVSKFACCELARVDGKFDD